MTEREACLYSPVESWVKHWLSPPCRSPHSLEEGALAAHWSSHQFCNRKRLALALVLLLALVIMAMLLLLNYYCIMVWHVCHQEETLALPKFESTGVVLENQ